VIPNWYIIALALVTVAYYGAFRKHAEAERDYIVGTTHSRLAL